jgi:hypothetical protein
MKTSTFRLLNFFGINLLLVSLYLNFIHEDNNTIPEIPVKTTNDQHSSPKQKNDGVTKTTTQMDKQGTVLN